MTTDARLREVVIAALGIAAASYRDDLKVGDLPEWDSVAQLDLILAIEQAFGVRFSTEQMTELTSLEALRQFLQSGHGG